MTPSAEAAISYGICWLPAIAIDGQLVDRARRGPDEESLSKAIVAERPSAVAKEKAARHARSSQFVKCQSRRRQYTTGAAQKRPDRPYSPARPSALAWASTKPSKAWRK